MVRALHAISGGPLRHQQRLKERALEALVEGKPYRAVSALRSLLRLAHADGSWGDVIETRELLATPTGAGAVRMVFEVTPNYDSQWAAINADRLGAGQCGTGLDPATLAVGTDRVGIVNEL